MDNFLLLLRFLPFPPLPSSLSILKDFWLLVAREDKTPLVTMASTTRGPKSILGRDEPIPLWPFFLDLPVVCKDFEL